MTITNACCLGDIANFQATGRRGRPPGSKNKNRRLWGDIRTVGDKAIYGGGAGFAGVGVLPFRSTRVDKALRSKATGRIPLVGKGIRQMALDLPKIPKGNFLASNLPAQTAAGLALGTAGAAYGLNKVRQDRRRIRLARQRRR